MSGDTPGLSREARRSNIPDRLVPTGSPPEMEQGSPSPGKGLLKTRGVHQQPGLPGTCPPRPPACQESASEDVFICVFPEGRDGWFWFGLPRGKVGKARGSPAKPTATARCHFWPSVFSSAPYTLPCRVLGGKLAVPTGPRPCIRGRSSRPGCGAGGVRGQPSLGTGNVSLAEVAWGGVSYRSWCWCFCGGCVGGGVQDHGDASERGVEEQSLCPYRKPLPPRALCSQCAREFQPHGRPASGRRPGLRTWCRGLPPHGTGPTGLTSPPRTL